MITLLLTLASIAVAQDAALQCENVSGTYNIADGRGRFVDMTAEVTQTGCDLDIVFGTEQHGAQIEGRALKSADEAFTGELDTEGRILWSNGWYYWPMDLPAEILPLDCLHPFSLYCYESCAECVPCAQGLDDPVCETCGRCEMCLDYIPCLDAIQHMPECTEPEAFQCLRECRNISNVVQCSDCADRMYCLDAFNVVVPNPPGPQPGLDKYIEISNYPCRTHGQDASTLNQRYLSQGMGANGREIFRGADSPQWWIYWDDDCGGDQSHSPQWYLTIQEADFIAVTNLGGNTGGCTNTLKIREVGFPSFNEIDQYMCDGEEEGWNNSFMQNGLKVNVESGLMTADCDVCVAEFNANGGCDCWLDATCDPSQMVPEGCDHCERQAAEFCGTTIVVPPPMPQEKWIEITNYPCGTHGQGQETINQKYVSRGLGANGREIFQGTIAPQWWIYFDDDCGGDRSHPSAWYVTVQEPSFTAPSNLGGRIGGCTNTMRIEEEHFPTMNFISSFMCDREGWENSFTQNGWQVTVEFGMTDIIVIPCIDDHERFKQIVNERASTNPDPAFMQFVAVVNAHGCDIIRDDERTKQDWCHQIDGSCNCACGHIPTPMPEQHCMRDEECLYMGCEDSPVCQMRAEGWGVCMAGGVTCPMRPEAPPQEPELCTQHSQCHYAACEMPEFTLPGHCSGADDAHRDCSRGECMCVNGNVDERCAHRSNNFNLADGGWCFDGRRDSLCPINHERRDCLRVENGNYQLNELNDGLVVGHMTMTQFPESCQGEAKVVDQTYIRFEAFANAIRATTEEGEVYVGIPNAVGGHDWNGEARSFPIPCMVVYTGDYHLMGPNESNGDFGVVGRHTLQQDGCNAISLGDDGVESRFQLTEDSISGMVGPDRITGTLIEGTQSLRWDNGYESHPIFEDDHPVCQEDGHRFAQYVRSVVPNTEDPKIKHFLTEVDFGGCEVLRRDHDAKYDWCTFHPEVRDACGCVCEEMTRPKPVCDRDQFKEWLHRDLGEACTDLFIAGLAEEHRPACECLRGIPQETADELFGSECYFTEWSDRSFLQVWRSCQWH